MPLQGVFLKSALPDILGWRLAVGWR